MVEAARKHLTDAAELEALAVEVASALSEKRAEEIVVLRVRELLPISSFFVIASATSGRAAQSLADAAERVLRATGLPLLGRHGREEGRWICLDYVEIVVHIFERTERRHYDLENLWSAAPRVEVS
jgi:ribosome-associated protein